MRKLILILSIIVLCSSKINAQEGVLFEHMDYEQALVKSQKSNKLLFVDCYTSWCGPCKKLATEIFPQKKVGDYMNERFVCVKFDVEKPENRFIAAKFEVKAYPTLLIIGPDGKLIDRILGYQQADKLIESLENSIDKDKSLKALSEKYESGSINKEDLALYHSKLMNSKSKDADVVAEKLYSALTKEEKLSARYWYFYSNERLTSDSSSRIIFIKDNYRVFCENIGKQKVDKILERTFERKMIDVIAFKTNTTKKELTSLYKEFTSYKLTNIEQLLSTYRLAVAAQKDGLSGLVKESGKEIQLLASNPDIWAKTADYIMKNGTKEDKDMWMSVSKEVLKTTKNDTLISVLNAWIKIYGV